RACLAGRPDRADHAGLRRPARRPPGRRPHRLPAQPIHREAGVVRRRRCRGAGATGRRPMIALTVNGRTHQVEVDPDTPLLYVLRNDLGLNGAKFGCGLGQCGACTVLLDDKPVFSCLVPVAALRERKIRTIEGLATAEGKPGPLSAAFEAEQAAQCGYCIAGMIVRAQALLERNTRPTEDEVR